MKATNLVRIATRGAFCGSALLVGHVAAAAGFNLLEQNASGLGNSYAGAAAVAEDASTIYFNSAGLTELKQPSLVLSVAGINIKSKFKDSGSSAALGQTLGGNGGNAGGFTALPALYVAVPLNDNMVGGIGVNAPFGLKTDYNNDWAGRFQAIKSDVKTTNLNTALAFKVNKVVSIGIGADYQTLEATLTKGVNYTAVIGATAPAALAAPANLGLQGVSSVKGSDAAWGFDVGVLLNLSERTKVGVSYRSPMKYQVQGNANITAPTSTDPTGQAIIAGARAGALANGPVTLDIKLPATARIAATQKVGAAVELLGEVSWTQWNSISELRVKRTTGETLSNTPENWQNTLRYAVGANYQLSNGVKLRAGAALDKSPVPEATRTARLPDNDRTWLSAGAKINVGKRASVDVGYAHVMAKDAKLNQNDGSTNAYGLLQGEQKSTYDIVALQATVSF